MLRRVFLNVCWPDSVLNTRDVVKLRYPSIPKGMCTCCVFVIIKLLPLFFFRYFAAYDPVFTGVTVHFVSLFGGSTRVPRAQITFFHYLQSGVLGLTRVLLSQLVSKFTCLSHPQHLQTPSSLRNFFCGLPHLLFCVCVTILV